MNEKKKSLVYQTKANDVDEKGVVTVAVNGIGVVDTQNDISMPGSFDQTLKDDIARMRHFLNHDMTQLVGVPLEGAEVDGNLVMVSQLNLNKEIGRDTLADYKLYAEAGRTLEHSIGVQAIKRDSEDKRKVEQWKMYEFSTLTAWGSNPQTFLVNIKSATRDQVEEAVAFVRRAFETRGYTQERLKNYDMELNLLLKSLDGGVVVRCPHCGYQFDYEEQPEIGFSQQVLETAGNCISWLAEGIVYEELEKLEPEIRAEVLSLLDSRKGGAADFTTKSITDLAKFVRCPHCASRVYRADNILSETKEEKTEEAPAESKSDESGFFAKLNESFTF